MKFELYMIPVGMMFLACGCFIYCAYLASQLELDFQPVELSDNEKVGLGLLFLTPILF